MPPFHHAVAGAMLGVPADHGQFITCAVLRAALYSPEGSGDGRALVASAWLHTEKKFRRIDGQRDLLGFGLPGGRPLAHCFWAFGARSKMEGQSNSYRVQTRAGEKVRRKND